MFSDEKVGALANQAMYVNITNIYCILDRIIYCEVLTMDLRTIFALRLPDIANYSQL